MDQNSEAARRCEDHSHSEKVFESIEIDHGRCRTMGEQDAFQALVDFSEVFPWKLAEDKAIDPCHICHSKTKATRSFPMFDGMTPSGPSERVLPLCKDCEKIAQYAATVPECTECPAEASEQWFNHPTFDDLLCQSCANRYEGATVAHIVRTENIVDTTKYQLYSNVALSEKQLTGEEMMFYLNNTIDGIVRSRDFFDVSTPDTPVPSALAQMKAILGYGEELTFDNNSEPAVDPPSTLTPPSTARPHVPVVGGSAKLRTESRLSRLSRLSHYKNSMRMNNKTFGDMMTRFTGATESHVNAAEPGRKRKRNDTKQELRASSSRQSEQESGFRSMTSDGQNDLSGDECSVPSRQPERQRNSIPLTSDVHYNPLTGQQYVKAAEAGKKRKRDDKEPSPTRTYTSQSDSGYVSQSAEHRGNLSLDEQPVKSALERTRKGSVQTTPRYVPQLYPASQMRMLLPDHEITAPQGGHWDMLSADNEAANTSTFGIIRGSNTSAKAATGSEPDFEIPPYDRNSIRQYGCDGCFDDEASAPSPATSTVPHNKTTQDKDESTNPATASDKAAARKMDRAALRARYEAKLTGFLAARNADGPNGRPAKNRAELIEGRRIKEERRKARKKELRAKARADAEAEAKAKGQTVVKDVMDVTDESDDDEGVENEVEAEAERLSGGKVGLDAPMPRDSESFTFGRFENASDNDSSDYDGGPKPAKKKKKGPRDLKTAIALVEKQNRRISALDAEKRAKAREQEAWKGAAARISGEKVKNDAGLLKKSLKKREKGKERGKKAWEEREKGVKAGMAMKQKKRTENLQKRRPGFEGTFKIGKRTL